MNPIYRQATREELATIIAWAGREGWNPGLEDIDPFWAADPDGYWLAETEGRLAACISLVHHTPETAFLGFYIADPALRGQGIGLGLWQAAVTASKAHGIGLDGVVAQQDNYRKSGFAYAHANRRYGGPTDAGLADAGVRDVSQAMLPSLIDHDARMSPSRRERFMRAWLSDSRTRRSFYLIEDGRIGGMGTIRACASGHKIGPLFAGDERTAERLCRHMIDAVAARDIIIDVPEPNGAALALCKRLDLAPVFETARMYRGVAPQLPLGHVYGITSFELG